MEKEIHIFSEITQVITVRSCGKVMFSQACVKNSVHGGPHMHGKGSVLGEGGMRGKGGHAW